MEHALSVKRYKNEELTILISESTLNSPKDIYLSNNKYISFLFTPIYNKEWEIELANNVYAYLHIPKVEISYNSLNKLQSAQKHFYIGQTQIIPYKDEKNNLFYLYAKNSNDELMQQSKVGAKYVIGSNPALSSYYPLYLEDSTIQTSHVSIIMNEECISVETLNQSGIWLNNKVVGKLNSKALLRTESNEYISVGEVLLIDIKDTFVKSTYSDEFIKFAKKIIKDDSKCKDFLYEKFNPSKHEADIIKNFKEKTKSSKPDSYILLIYQYYAPDEEAVIKAITDN